ncbi:hypothetical protein PoMZ_06412, partial [Pyricularia oryzae]
KIRGFDEVEQYVTGPTTNGPSKSSLRVYLTSCTHVSDGQLPERYNECVSAAAAMVAPLYLSSSQLPINSRSAPKYPLDKRKK